MEAFLVDFLPRVIPREINWKIIDHRSKWQLLREVPKRLLGYANYQAVYRPKALVLVDRDDDDCLLLKAALEKACVAAQLTTHATLMHGDSIDVVNRIVIEELEAWYFGDVPALAQAWPGVPLSLAGRASLRDPDLVFGGTHEALLRVLQKAGHFKDLSRLPKIDAARRMGALIEPARNRSQSFQIFWTGLQALVNAT